MLKQSPFSNRLILRDDPAISPYTHDTIMAATPDAVFRPDTVSELQDMMRYCNRQNIPVTISAARTSMTGSAVSDVGIVISLEKFDKIISLDEDNATITVQPNIILGEVQRQVESRGFFYPPSPTSRNECTIGGTIATNATGDTTFKYGTTRKHVLALTVVLADGSLRTLTRQKPPPVESKNTAGYFLNGEEIDYFIGSEGTLGIIVEATVKLMRGVPNFLTFLIPFPSNMDALHFIATHEQLAAISPRTMEYVDDAAADIMRQHPSFPKFPETARAFIICQQEFLDGDEEDCIEAWFSALTATFTQIQATPLLESIIVARTSSEHEKIASWRHHIPATVGEHHVQLQKTGGGKVGTDWWVPLPCMIEMMQWMYTKSAELGIPFIAFGHLGNGHPHVNYLTRNAEEKERARAVVIDNCKKAVSLGGGVAGEHGLGKLKRDLLALQYPPHVLEEMRKLKTTYDPHWILGRGNIFNSPSI